MILLSTTSGPYDLSEVSGVVGEVDAGPMTIIGFLVLLFAWKGEGVVGLVLGLGLGLVLGLGLGFCLLSEEGGEGVGAEEGDNSDVFFVKKEVICRC